MGIHLIKSKAGDRKMQKELNSNKSRRAQKKREEQERLKLEEEMRQLKSSPNPINHY